ncbi:MAG: hypothetical protein KDC69_11580, partial [Flavobacteriaceae bacterium]|nr:hypothetical protein [Flavobacteriaceae bacterium]
ALFDGFCFPNQRDAVSAISIQDGFINLRINPDFSHLLSPFRMLYFSEENIKIFAIREMLDSEIEIMKKYTFKPTRDMVYDSKKFDSHFRYAYNGKLNSFREIIHGLDSNNFNWNHVSGLHIHHKYYIKNLLPWEYDNKALITLCVKCHESLHKNGKVSVYNDKMELLGEFNYCKRCHGAGWFPEYTHVQGGVCFRCRGAKYEELIPN